MNHKTRDYKQFSYREDNRSAINHSHLKRLIESIKARNLLELRPIIVNEKLEIMDGQHRLLAAQELGLEIWYRIEKKLTASDIITLNNVKAWGIHDYMNFYIKNGYEEYSKLADFIKRNNLQLRIAFNMTMGSSKNAYLLFKNGEYKFANDIYATELDICWQTIDYIKRMNGFSAYTSTSKFWNALLKLVKNKNFDGNKWMSNLSKMVERCTAKATSEDYCRLFMEINNWKNTYRLNLVDEV